MGISAHLVSPFYTALKMSKVVVLTGAGASVLLGMPAMEGFFKRLPNAAQQKAGVFLDSLKERKDDLEFLLGRLDWFHKLDEQSKADSLLQDCLRGPRLGDIARDARDLREEIFRTIIQIYGELSLEARAKAVEIYKDLYFGLLEEAFNHPKVLPIFTTNYDLTFEALRDAVKDFKICNGTQLEGDYKVWSPETYEGHQYEFPVFRLHGCSHWMRRKSDNRIVFTPAPDRDNLTAREPCILYPEPGKDSRADDPPFNTAYQHLHICLLGAEWVVVIGYSGRDEAIQQELRMSVAAGPQRKFVIVTKRDLLPERLASIIPEANRTHLRGGIEHNTLRILQALKGNLPAT